MRNYCRILFLCTFFLADAFYSHAQTDNSNKPGWLADSSKLRSDDVELHIRTLNINEDWPDLPIRIIGAAQQIHKIWPHQLDLIGVQETGLLKFAAILCENSRGGGPARMDGAACLAVELQRLFKFFVFSVRGGGVGTVIGKDWMLLSEDHWQFGFNIFKPGTWKGHRRWLQEVKVQHRSKGWILRFYNTHLSPADIEKREYQAEWATKKIRERIEPGELPPIFGGDFNAGRIINGEPPDASVLELEKYFHRPLDARIPSGGDTGIDLIYIGRKDVFTQTNGDFVLMNEYTVDLGAIDLVDGFPNFRHGLSDHATIGLSFKLIFPNIQSFVIAKEGNNCSQDQKGIAQYERERCYNFKKGDNDFDNDEARSFLIRWLPRDAIIEVFDDSNGKTNDDWTRIRVKKMVPEYCIGSFENSYEDDVVAVEHFHKNGLDGKVSHLCMH